MPARAGPLSARRRVTLKEALLLRNTGDLAGAEGCFLRLLSEPASPQAQEMSNGVEAGLRGGARRAQSGLAADAAGAAGRSGTAVATGTCRRPDYPIRMAGARKLYLSQSRWSDLEQTIRHLEAQPGRFVESAVLRARNMERREFAAATAVLKGVIDRPPQALWPRVVLSHVYLIEGRNRAGMNSAAGRAGVGAQPSRSTNLAALLRPSP